MKNYGLGHLWYQWPLLPTGPRTFAILISYPCTASYYNHIFISTAWNEFFKAFWHNIWALKRSLKLVIRYKLLKRYEIWRKVKTVKIYLQHAQLILCTSSKFCHYFIVNYIIVFLFAFENSLTNYTILYIYVA